MKGRKMMKGRKRMEGSLSALKRNHSRQVRLPMKNLQEAKEPPRIRWTWTAGMERVEL
uniref:Uncharacterized protein n=1 Tax=Zea mays TaxID=4577 RepID=B4FZ93_MAIZE|nr:unknown [Zea mays]